MSPDGKRLADDLAAIAPVAARKSQLGTAATRARIAAKAGKSTQGSTSGGGGGSATEDASVARAHYATTYLSTPDGLFVLALQRIHTLPMKDATQSPVTWTFENR